MSHPKKNFNPCRCGVINIILGVSILLFPFIILNNFSYALFYLLIISSFSSFNVLNVNKKTVLPSFHTPFATSEDSKSDKLGKKTEKKEFSLWKVFIFLMFGTIVYYTVSVIFGAPVFESYAATLYFSALMTILTVYPLVWYFFFTDSLVAVLKILSNSKVDNLSESQLHTMMLCTVLGAWFGAFPIPLDWDRPWQTWPITCCIGAVLGNSIAHFIIGFRVIFTYFRDRRKVMLNRTA